jgi:hypothetical protein
VTEWTTDGRAAAWETTIEPEFDANERDSWEALAEFRAAICPKCGHLKVLCSDPGGLHGKGYHISQQVCWPTAILEATQRRVARRFKDEQPDLNGMLTTDGVHLGISLEDDGSEDLLGLDAARSELADRLAERS